MHFLMDFTGERVVPGQTDGDLWAEHFSRYLFAGGLVKGMRVLDLGTGAGYGAAHLSTLASSVVAVDVSAEAIDYARQRFPGRGVEYVIGDARQTSLPSHSFDAVVCFEVIEHVDDPERIVQEAKRLLRPHGLFVVSTPNHSYYSVERNESNHFHVHEFEVDEFRVLLERYFPSVGLFTQNHVAAVVVAPAATAPSVATLAQLLPQAPEHNLKTTHYVVAVCGDRSLDPPSIVCLPEQEGNVLRDRERHIRVLRAELDESRGRDTWAKGVAEQLHEAQTNFEQLKVQFEERTRWAQSLEGDLTESRKAVRAYASEAERLKSELDKSNAWALDASGQLAAQVRQTQASDAQVTELKEALREGTEQARFERERMEFELVRARERTAMLDAQLLDQSGRVERLEATVAGVTERLGALRATHEQLSVEHQGLLRTRGVRAQRLAELAMASAASGARLAKGLTLQAGAAALALPIAGVVGAAGMLAEGVGRILPTPARPAPLVVRDLTTATLLILNYNGRDLLAKNLPSCQAAIARSGRAHEILVVDNGSDDGSVEFVRQQFPDVKLATLSRNRFFSAGNNFGLPYSSREIVVLLNNDMRVEPDFLDPLIAPFASDSALFAVASQILMDPTKRREETGLTRGNFENGELKFRHQSIPPSVSGLIPILWAGGGAAAFDRRKLLELGGLDTMFDPFYCEDLDLSLRAWARGWKVVLAPESKVWHDHRTTSRRVFGEQYVNEIFRRNTLLLHWANVRESGAFGQHVLALPRIAARYARESGWSGVRSLLRAALKAPQAISRRLHVREPGPRLTDVMDAVDAGVLPIKSGLSPKRLRWSDPLKIIMVAPYHLYPVEHGGGVFMYEAIRELARRGNEVSLVGFVDSDSQLDAAAHLKAFCKEVRLLKRASGPLTQLLTPSPVEEFASRPLRHALLELVDRLDPDVIQAEYTHMAQYRLPSARHINALAEHDIAYLSLKRRVGLLTNPSERRRVWGEYLKMYRYEHQALPQFDLVQTMTEREAEVLRRSLLKGSHIVGNCRAGIDVDRWATIERLPSSEPVGLFVGSFGHPPNVDAVQYFVREVLPQIWARLPDFKLIVAGGSPPASLRALQQDPRIRVLGFVEDLRPLYETATVFVAPVRTGAGVRVKLLETFATGLPVVASSFAVDGLEVSNEHEVLLADDPARFAAGVLSLCENRELGVRLGTSARHFVSTRFRWQTVIAQLEQEYRVALIRRGLHEEFTP